MKHWKTLSEVLEYRAQEAEAGITFISKSDSEDFLSYMDLYGYAGRVLGVLQAQGMVKGNELVIQVDDLKTFITVFWACLLGGIIPVPLAVGGSHGHKRKLFNAWKLLAEPYLLITPKAFSATERFAEEQQLENEIEFIRKRVISTEQLDDASVQGKPCEISEDDIAFIQFSSGSTGSPKGVVLTHKNLLTNIGDISEGGGYSASDSMLSWMPLTHDMGLIGFHLNPLVVGMNHYLMPTFLFIRNPSLWLTKAAEHKVSVLCSPNFGYEYVMSHFRLASDTVIDLSSVRIIYNGAEPVSFELYEKFAERFEEYQLSRKAVCPVYGLAEASLAVAMTALSLTPEFLEVKRSSLLVGEPIELAEGEAGSIRIVNVGKAITHCELCITDRSGRVLKENYIGQIHIKGSNVTSGYYHNADATEQVLTGAGWLNTGDLGFLKDGQLYVTGREKDVFFVNGLNVYPHDLEQVASELPGIVLNKIIVAGGYFEKYGREVSVAFVLFKDKPEKFTVLSAAVSNHINEQTGVLLDFILPIREIPKTTSGKLQRFKVWQQFLDGKFSETLSDLYKQESKTEDSEVVDANQEEWIARCWKRCLKLDPIPANKSFIQLGGNSLRAAQVCMAVWKELGIEVSVSTLFESLDLQDFTEKIGELQRTAGQAIPEAGKSESYPLAAAQRLIYFAWASDRKSIAYNVPVALRISGKLEKGRLISLLNQLIRRHEVLRYSFELRAGKPVIHISEALDIEPEIIPLDENEEVAQLLKAQIRPFDLSKPPLVHVHIFVRGDQPEILLLDFHHIIADGLSIQQFINELTALLADQSLTEQKIKYSDFTTWEHAGNTREQGAVGLTFWKMQLGKDLPRLELPTDWPRPPVFNSLGGKVQRRLSDKTTGQLRDFALEQGLTLHQVLFSVYQVLLWKYTRQDQAVIGIPVSGRYHPDLEDQFGMFVNNLALRTEIVFSESFTELLETNRKLLNQAFEYQNIPFEKVAEAIGGPRDASRNLLFDTMFSYQHIGLSGVESGEHQLSVIWFDDGSAKYDLSLEISESESKLEYQFEYATQLLGPQLIERMADYFEVLINELVTFPVKPLHCLGEEPLPAREMGDQGHKSESLPSIDEAFRKVANQNRLKVAAYGRAGKLTYGELDELADKVAIALQSHEISAGSIVAVMMDRSLDILAVYLAVLKAGAAFLPVDIGTPVERVKWILKDSRSLLLIVDEERIHELSKGLKEVSASVISYKMLIDQRQPTKLISPKNRSEDLAYIIYTSGSTGRPKGVMVEHHSLMNYVAWAGTAYIKAPETIFSFFTSIAFDLTLTSVFVPLLNGGSVKVFEEEATLEYIFSDREVNVFKLTPSHLQLIRKHQIMPGAQVGTLIVGGEAFDTGLARDISDKFDSEVIIYNEYGPTEATIGCMIYRFDPEDSTPTVPIGRPIKNIRIWLLDEHLMPVAPGAMGELYVSGSGLARGYRYNARLTKERFIKNPFREGERMYRTGDRARLWNGNKLIYLGRIDDQVKLNGYRVELAEVELSLQQHPAIESVVVCISNEETDDASVLCAYYVGRSREKVEEETLRDFLVARLPHYMIPLHFVELEKFPLTLNGKVDLKALPKPERVSSFDIEEKELTEIEAMLSQLWTEVLAVGEPKLTDLFFELGGDSIKAVQLSAKCRERGFQLEVRDVLTYQTIRHISTHVSPLINGQHDQHLKEGRTGLWPILSWFSAQNFDYPAFYNQSVLLELSADLSADEAKQALKLTIQGLDELRINLDLGNEEIFYNKELVEETFEIKSHRVEDSNELVVICEKLKGSLTFDTGLLIKASMIQQANKPYRLFITAHHALVDGISWRVLLGDFQKNCESIVKGGVQHSPLKTAGILDWKRAVDTYEEGVTDLTYWEKTILIPFKLPQDYLTDDWRIGNRKKISWKLDDHLTTFLLAGANRAYGTEVPHLLNTALALVLKQWMKTAQFVVEHENHGRHLEVDVSRTLGWFTAMYPVTIELVGDNLAEQIKGVKEQLRSVPDHGSSYPLFLKETGESKQAFSTRSQVRFNYLGDLGAQFYNDMFRFSQEYTGTEIHPENQMTAVIEWNSMVLNGCLNMELLYNSKAHSHATAKALSDQFFYEISRILAHLKDQDDIHFTPSDFQDADLNQEELDALFS